MHTLAHPEIAALVVAYVADSAPVLAFRLDSGLRVRDANLYARQVLGMNVDGSHFAGLLPDFIVQPDVAQLATVPEEVTLVTLNTTSGMPESFGFRFFALVDGSILALGSPDVAEQSRLQAAALALNHELNIRKRQLHQVNAELRDLSQLKTQFLGMAAHDLRRPISVILTHGEFVLDEAGDQLSEVNIATSCAPALPPPRR